MSSNIPEVPEGTLAISSKQQLHLKRATLRVTSGEDQGASLELGPSARIIGSSEDCDLVLNDSFVSRRHLEIVPRSTGILLRDLGSRNGCYLGKTRILEVIISESAVITLGKTTIAISISEGQLDVPLSDKTTFGAALGASPAMRAVFYVLEQASQTDVTVLLEGASGTGKDILATSLHEVSPRHAGPYVVVDCGSIPENLIESELFGHEKDAFIGASATRVGAFEQADGGTLLLDEIGELPLEMQHRLLRALETRTFRRVGGDRSLSSDVRFVAATNRSLSESVRRGEFRQDLYYRLNVVQVRVPSLSERPEDIPLLAEKFLVRATGNQLAELPPSLGRVLTSHFWPGNVRELRNVVERFATFQTTDPRLLFGAPGDASVGEDNKPPQVGLHLERVLHLEYHEAKRQLLDDLHKRLLPAVLASCDGNISEAAKRLAIPRTSLHRMLKNLESGED